MTTTTEMTAAKAEAKVLRMLNGGMLDARCALPAVLADALSRLVAAGSVTKVAGGTFGYYKAVARGV